MFKKTIISEFFTTVSFKQALISLYLMTFWSYKLINWKEIYLAENSLKNYLWANDWKIISFYNARSALFHCLKSVWITKNDEIIVNWYNCVSVSNAVIQSWWKIVYSDIDEETLSFDLKILEKTITKNTKVIIVQHTFWKIANIEEIVKLAKDKWIIIIEDCAHSLWTHVKWKHSWTYWDFAIFSSGRDKVLSSVTWGFLLINSAKYQKYEKSIRDKLINPSIKMVIQNHMYNIVWYKSYKLYDFFKLWRVIIFLSRKLKLITEILSVSEKSCNFNELNYKLPNSLAYLFYKEIDLLHEYKRDKRTKSQFYNKNLNKKFHSVLIEWKNEKTNYFRYPILLKNKKEKNLLIHIWRRENIIFWTQWSGQNIIPVWTDLKNAWYKLWSCPVAENISKRIITLPNHKLITQKDLERVVYLLNKF